MQMRECSVQCFSPAGLHRMAYTEWGDPHNPRVLICVHGLTRCGRDFDFLADSLAAEYRVICPDVVGRGRSDRLADKTLYGIQQYVGDMITLIARLDVAEVSWLGTSMGGLIGMVLAAQGNSPVKRLILNDCGPVLKAAALARIGEYVGRDPRFESIEQAEQFVRQVSATFGQLSDAQWRHLTVHTVRTAADGKVEFIYDPGIALSYQPLVAEKKDIDLWQFYDAIRCPTLVLRGAQSDLLLPDTVAEMARRGPRARSIEIPGVGHAPMLMEPAQVALVADFLRAG
jgi:pimeloyl-ACP methyl ester carboxylesterase